MCSPRSRLAWQVLPAAAQISLLAEEVGKTHVHVRRGPQHGLAGFVDSCKRLLVDLRRLAEPALRDPDVGQGDRGSRRRRDRLPARWTRAMPSA